jgi:hypothetical protein
MSTQKNEPVKLTTIEDRILQGLVEKDIREIIPKRTDHKIAYTDLEGILGEVSEKKLKSILKSLTLKGYLKERDYDSVLLCPNCNSSQVYTRYNCPQCQSININRVQLIEHKSCGYIGNRSEFEQEEGLICPKCKTEIDSPTKAQPSNKPDSKQTIRVIGSSFECEKCGSRFEKPLATHTCKSCSANFSYREANYERLPAYTLTERVDTLTPTNFETDALRKIEKIIQNKGYTVELNAKIKGRSSFEQTFDLIAKRGSETILLDISSWGNQNDLISLLGKKMDVVSNSIILVDLAGNPSLTTLAKPYNITVLDGREGKIEEEINRVLKGVKEKEAKRSSFFRRGK